MAALNGISIQYPRSLNLLVDAGANIVELAVEAPRSTVTVCICRPPASVHEVVLDVCTKKTDAVSGEPPRVAEPEKFMEISAAPEIVAPIVDDGDGETGEVNGAGAA